MADQVEAVLDTMVPDLSRLIENGVFDEEEVRAVVRRRRESEYLLRRREPRKADFLRYVDAEIKLERLRALRQKRLDRAAAAGSRRRRRRRDVDGCVVRHVHFVYSRALRRWPEDVSLHLRHAAFARSTRSYRRLSRVYADALRAHPREERLWIEAASHEFFGDDDRNDDDDDDDDHPERHGGSVESARVLLQRGIRVNPTSKRLYVQYFELEWHYVQKLRGRDKVFQNKEDGDDESAWSEEKRALYEGALPRIIYEQAIKAIPDDVDFRMEFVASCEKFPSTEKMIDEIYASVRRDLCDRSVQAWIALASRRLRTDDASALAPPAKKPKPTVPDDDGQHPPPYHDPSSSSVFEILDEALVRVGTPEMYVACVELLSSFARGSPEIRSYVALIADRAASVGADSPRLRVARAEARVSARDVVGAERILADAVAARGPFRTDATVWTAYADLVGRLEKTGLLDKVAALAAPDRVVEGRRAVLRRATDAVPVADAAGHATVLSRRAEALLESDDDDVRTEIEEVLFDRLAGTGTLEKVPGLCLRYLERTRIRDGLVAARRVGDKVLSVLRLVPSSERGAEDAKRCFRARLDLERDEEDDDADARRRRRGKVRAIAREFYRDDPEARREFHAEE